MLGYLVAARSAGDLIAMEYLQSHIAALVQLIVGVIALNDDLLAVDELVDGHRGALGHHLFDYLLHFGRRQRYVVQAVAMLVVLVQDRRPVVDKVLLGGIAQHTASVVPSIGLQTVDDRFLKSRFAIEHHQLLLPQLS